MRNCLCLLRLATATCLLIAAHAGPLEAHAFAERYDLPLPLWYYLIGAGVTVAVSFAAAALFIKSERGERKLRPDGPNLREPFGSGIALRKIRVWRAVSHPAVIAALRLLSVGIFLIAIAAGFLGVQAEPLDNLLPVLVWIIWWVGFTYVSALVGDLWRVVNPVAVIADWWSRVFPARSRPPVALPDRFGVWPAVMLFAVFVWAELAWPSNAVPAKLASAVLIYCGVTWTAMAVFGRESWMKRGDPFSYFFGLIARFSPFDPSTQSLRAYGSGLMLNAPVSGSELAFVLLALSTVSFDGLRETPAWNEMSSAAMGGLYRAGLLAVMGNVAAGAAVKTAGILAVFLAFAGAYLAISRWSAAIVNRSQHRHWRTSEIAGLFVSSLVPIAIAYHLAHYLSYLIVQGQAIIPLASDPFGAGWNLFGTRAYHPDLTMVNVRFVWTAAVAAIVAGHVAAVLVAHVTALRAFGGARASLTSQYPMLAAMIGYTMFSLWVLSQPIVEGS